MSALHNWPRAAQRRPRPAHYLLSAAPDNNGPRPARRRPQPSCYVLKATPDNSRIDRTKPNRGAQWAPRLIGFAAHPGVVLPVQSGLVDSQRASAAAPRLQHDAGLHVRKAPASRPPLRGYSTMLAYEQCFAARPAAAPRLQPQRRRHLRGRSATVTTTASERAPTPPATAACTARRMLQVGSGAGRCR